MSADASHQRAWAEISISALANNVAAIKTVIAPTALCGVVKANGYGHGMAHVARTLMDAGVEWFAVATVDEGIELREAGIDAQILLLAEIPEESMREALASSLTLTVGSLEGARAARAQCEQRGGVHRVHVKVDTGMHRMGVAPEHAQEVVALLAKSKCVDVEGLWTHFSVADSSNPEQRFFTRGQIERFDQVVNELGPQCPRLLHLANSAGALGFPEARRDLARVGLALYGYLPEPWLAYALAERGVHLVPVMSLRARVVATRRVLAGERPSYGRRRALVRDSNIVTVPFGYADGFARRLFDAGAQVLINGRRYDLAGVVTMDQLVVDVGDDDVKVGDDVVLLGCQGSEEVNADEWAHDAGTITWEVLCAVGARVPRVLVD